MPNDVIFLSLFVAVLFCVETLSGGSSQSFPPSATPPPKAAASSFPDRDSVIAHCWFQHGLWYPDVEMVTGKDGGTTAVGRTGVPGSPLYRGVVGQV